MHPSVLAAFVPFNAPLEGVLPWMYVDRINYVTTGMGNLIDPKENALNLQWHHLAGQPDRSTPPFPFTGPVATPEEVYAAWSKVKASGMAGAGGGKQGHLTDLRLDDAGIAQAVHQKLTNNEAFLRARIPQWDAFPADAQLALLSMAWAMGPGFSDSGTPSKYFPKMMAAILAGNFAAAAEECKMQPDTDPTLHKRNVDNREMLLAAAKVVQSGAPVQTLSDNIEQMILSAGGSISAAAVAALKAARAAGHSAESAAQQAAEAGLRTAEFKGSKPLGALFWVGVGLLGLGAYKVWRMRA